MELEDKYKTHYLNCQKASKKYRETHKEFLREKAKNYYYNNIEYQERKRQQMRENYHKKKELKQKTAEIEK